MYLFCNLLHPRPWRLEFVQDLNFRLVIQAKVHCTVLHMFRQMQLLFCAGNQSNFRPVLATLETLTDLYGDEAKKKNLRKK